MALEIAGKKIPTWALVGGGIGVALAGYIYLKNKNSSSSTTDPNAIDPVTGLPYSQDNQVDPLTGQTYLGEAQQYGSVSAAEAAYAGNGAGSSPLGSGVAAGTSTSNVNPVQTADGTSTGSTTSTTGIGTSTGQLTFSSNTDWAQSAVAALETLGYSSADATGAIAAYLSGMPLTASQSQLVTQAVAELGSPPNPVPIVTTPAKSASGSTSTTSAASSSWSFPAPGGLQAYDVHTDGYSLEWNAVHGPSGQAPSSYTVATYNAAGQEVDTFTTASTKTSEYGPGGKGLPKGTYHSNVWANGGPKAPSHSTVTVSLSK
jgi:hypothetical protein